MLILDARSGREVEIGRWVDLVAQVEHYDLSTDSFTPAGVDDDSYRILSVDAGVFTAAVEAQLPDGTRHKTRLPIRYMHPSFLFKRVLFIPS